MKNQIQLFLDVFVLVLLVLIHLYILTQGYTDYTMNATQKEAPKAHRGGFQIGIL